jgi:NitT/TauT family transport system permease protein
MPAILLAIALMIVMVVGVNVVFWRLLVAWAEKFRVETSESFEAPRSIVLDPLRRSKVPRRCGPAARAGQPAARPHHTPFGLAEYPLFALETVRTGDSTTGQTRSRFDAAASSLGPETQIGLAITLVCIE